MHKKLNPIKLHNDLTLPEPVVISGEFHNHTCVSPDVSEPYMRLENVLNVAFREDLETIPEEARAHLKEGAPFDFFMTAEHLRKSTRDVEGNDKVTAMWEALAEQATKYNELKAKGKYQNKVYYPAFEWDMPGLDHGALAVLTDGIHLPLDAIREFEWRYASETPAYLFTRGEEAEFGPRTNGRHELEYTYAAVEWLCVNYPDSFLSLNHPSGRAGKVGEVRIEHIRRLHNLAPHIFFSFEGLPGNQFSGDRGEYAQIYGGADAVLAEVGGVWDALLGEGRRIFTLANSDFHFKISSNGLYSSGYWPSEYSRNYFKAQGGNVHDIVNSLRSGNSFCVIGDLINALEFTAKVVGPAGLRDAISAEMGEELFVNPGEEITLTIRFRESERNNYCSILTGDSSNAHKPKVDHIDLVGGKLLGLAEDPTSPKNPTTRVIKRFKKEDWGESDAYGFYKIRYQIKVEEAMYVRLRGTNVPVNTAGITDVSGNPLQEVALRKSDYPTLDDFFQAVNERNYRNLWFYSNPIFVKTSDV